jgi:hypothetical protein
VLLRDEEDQTDDDRDDDDRPSERVTREPGDESDEEIVDRVVEQCCKERTKCSWSRELI